MRTKFPIYQKPWVRLPSCLLCAARPPHADRYLSFDLWCNFLYKESRGSVFPFWSMWFPLWVHQSSISENWSNTPQKGKTFFSSIGNRSHDPSQLSLSFFHLIKAPQLQALHAAEITKVLLTDRAQQRVENPMACCDGWAQAQGRGFNTIPSSHDSSQSSFHKATHCSMNHYLQSLPPTLHPPAKGK